MSKLMENEDKMSSASFDFNSTNFKSNDTTLVMEMALSDLGIAMFLSTLGAVLNVLVIVAFSKFKQLQTSTNKYLTCLAVTDLIFALTVIIAGVQYMFLRLDDVISCSVKVFMAVYVLTSSVVVLSLVTFDRYIAITNPIKYKQFTPKKHTRLITGCILYSAFIAGIGFIQPFFIDMKARGECDVEILLWDWFAVFLASHYIAAFAFMLFAYGKIIQAALIRQMRVQEMNQQHELQRAFSIIQMKATKMSALVVSSSIIFLLPHVVQLFLLNISHTKNLHLNGIRMICLTANSLLNPFIYFLANREFRTCFRKMFFGNCFSKSSRGSVATSSSNKTTVAMVQSLKPASSIGADAQPATHGSLVLPLMA